MISRVIRKFGLLVAATLVGGGAFAQSSPRLDWANYCWDLTDAKDGWNFAEIGTPMLTANVGLTGQALTMGGDPSPAKCFTITPGLWGNGVAAASATVPGSVSFSMGPPPSFPEFTGKVGSVQTTRDDYMLTTFGAPTNSGAPWSFSMLSVDGGRVAITDFATYFTGQSDRYVYAEGVSGSITVNLRVDVVGDAARVQWRLLNSDANPHNVGLWTGQWAAMMVQPESVNGFPDTAGIHPAYIPAYPGRTKPLYVTMPHNTPPIVEHRYKRSTDSATFPEYVNVLYSQNFAYGLRVENGPLDTNVFDTVIHGGVHDNEQVDTSGADEFVFGSSGQLLGGPSGAVDMPDVIFPEVFPGAGYSDVDPRPDGAWLQKFEDTDHVVAPGDERVIVQYFRSTWSNGDYRLPYATVVDAPKMFQPKVGNPATLSPASAPVRVSVDNTSGYSNINTGVAINNVRVTLKVAKSSGLTFDAADHAQESVQVFNGVQQVVRYSTKTIASIPARRLDFVDFNLTPNNSVTGDLPYEVTVEPTPGPTRVLKGTIYSSPTPTLALTAGANLVSVPWMFPDNSWTSILGLAPGSFTVFNWDAINKGYVPATSAERGGAAWLVTPQDFASLALNKNASIPNDVNEGYKNILLSPGWNLVGNPYNYRIKLGEIVGVSQQDSHSYIWTDLVSQGFVSGNIALWNPATQTYDFKDGFDAVLEPQTGFWLYVSAVDRLTLKFPPVYYEGIDAPTSRAATTWNKDTSKWRLNLVAATSKALDDKNYIGQVTTTKEVNTFTALKPPMSPVSSVEVSIEQLLNGKATRAAQAYTTNSGKQDWKVFVYSKEGGRVKLTWPNMSQLNRGLTFRLVDPASGVTRDMRQISGYDFDAKKDSTRELHVQVATGGSVRAMIGNVVAVRSGGRGPSSSFTISYTLSGEATTSVRILSATGREVYAITRGRADRAGENTVTWTLRDNANRAVAPGSYRVEVLAESGNGERSRRVIPVNVVR